MYILTWFLCSCACFICTYIHGMFFLLFCYSICVCFKIMYACVQESALARQSLYVKFDPLVGGNTPKRHLQGAAVRSKTGYVHDIHSYVST